MNYFLEFYKEHDISPVRQDISDFSKHLELRKKLYRQLGIPIGLLKGKEILEVGPGSGYNTLAFFEWGSNVDLVEPNKRGRMDMIDNFENKKIDKGRYTICESTIEEFVSCKMYDVVIAENFIPAVPNKKEIINKLKEFVTTDGIIVITCIDEISFFVERIKRFVAQALSNKIENFNEKVDFLLDVFGLQFKYLPNMTRDKKDWIQDMFLNPASNSSTLLSLVEAIDLFGDEYDVLGSSPHMFLDYSWFKDYKYNYKKDIKLQFAKKNCNLILTGEKEFILEPEQTLEIKLRLTRIENLAISYENKFSQSIFGEIIRELSDGIELWNLMGERFVGFCKETIEILEDINNVEKLKECNVFFSAFGRGTQYISFIKKSN